MYSEQQIMYVLISALCFIPAIVFHEVAHGFVAYKLGDPTAKRAGRLSLNPLKHIDPFGTVILPALMALMQGPVFGYAKPVPYNPSYFKDRRIGDVLVGLAGPAANLVMALVAAALMWALQPTATANGGALLNNDIFYYFYLWFLPYFTVINLYLMFFNLLPIPPLDGSSIFAIFIPDKHMDKYYTVERYAMPIFLVVAFILPSFIHVNLFGVYLDATAGNLARVLLPISV